MSWCSHLLLNFVCLCLCLCASENQPLQQPCALRWWQTRTQCCGHIVAHDCFYAAQNGKHLLRTQNVSERNQKHFCVSDTTFVSATNAARSSKLGNICVRNNVSATLCSRLPPPLFEASNLIMLNYDNSLRSSARDTKRRTITCNYLYKELLRNIFS